MLIGCRVICAFSAEFSAYFDIFIPRWFYKVVFFSAVMCVSAAHITFKHFACRCMALEMYVCISCYVLKPAPHRGAKPAPRCRHRIGREQKHTQKKPLFRTGCLVYIWLTFISNGGVLRETEQSCTSYSESQQANQKQEATRVWEEMEPFFFWKNRWWVEVRGCRSNHVRGICLCRFV